MDARKKIGLGAAVLALAAAAMIPAVTGDYYVSFSTEIVIMVLMLSSYRIVVLTGEWSFAHVVLQGVGAYTAAILVKDWGAPFMVSLLAGALVAGLVAAVLSFPLLKMRGFYFLMGTFGAAEAVRLLWRKFNYFGGTRGFSGISPPFLRIGNFAIDFGHPAAFFYLALTVCVVSLLVIWSIEQSRLGQIWRTIEQQDVLAQAVGIDTRRYRRIAFVISAVFAGVAGVLLAYAFGTVTPNRFNLNFALYLMIWAIVGGTRSFYGVILGGILLMGFDESLRFADELRPGVYGVILILVMLFWPQGLERLIGFAAVPVAKQTPGTPSGMAAPSKGDA
ncbi:branched-chain amino acid ABC transporter permease [Rhizobium sp. NZLR1b]|uniref:branched-chain amino acid ABC transporter permease n=2 Tax=unclassified Rhizobium TaxID=2613769 RepID=UPI001C835ACF|nr:branched-chain amino acid ABC transporter permease [Rhizobium sp. NZLR1b]MBX5173358.1 branched-chain amino acid ABC transporter permease [Rhizobium sp. NZLR1b]